MAASTRVAFVCTLALASCLLLPSAVTATGEATHRVGYAGASKLATEELLKRDSTPKHIAFVVVPERSHFNLIKNVMHELLDRGHRLSIVLNAKRRYWVEEAGLLTGRNVSFVPVPMVHQVDNTWADWSKLPTYGLKGGDIATRKLYSMSADYTPVALAAFRNDRPDFVIGDAILATMYDIQDALGLKVMLMVYSNVREPAVETSYAQSMGYFTEWYKTETMNVVRRLNALIFRFVYANFGNELYWRPLTNKLRAENNITVPHRQPKVNLMLEFPRDLPMLNTGLIDGFLPSRPHTQLMKMVGPCRDIPQDLKESQAMMSPSLAAWLDRDPDRPIIYVSMGTVVHLNHRQLSGIAQALQDPRWRVLWAMRQTQQDQYPEMKRLSEDGDSVLVVDFAPQVAVLAHPNVRAFFTHGGLSSAMETIWFRKPTICMGLFADQPMNCAAMHDRGLGYFIDFTNPDIPMMRKYITTLMTDDAEHQRMADGMLKINQINYSLGGSKAAADWIELTMRVGHEHLIPRVTQMHWISYWNLDAVALLIVYLLTLTLVLRLLVRLVFSRQQRRTLVPSSDKLKLN